MALSNKSNEEISRLLDDYGITHGPVVGSTRRLYERRLERAMGIVSAPSDFNNFREEDEDDESAYASYRTSAARQGYATLMRQRGNADSDEDSDDNPGPVVRTTARGGGAKSKTLFRRCMSLLFRMFLLAVILAVLGATVYGVYGLVKSADLI